LAFLRWPRFIQEPSRSESSLLRTTAVDATQPMLKELRDQRVLTKVFGRLLDSNNTR